MHDEGTLLDDWFIASLQEQFAIFSSDLRRRLAFPCSSPERRVIGGHASTTFQQPPFQSFAVNLHASTHARKTRRAEGETINALAIGVAAPMDTTMEEDDDMRIP
jgi:hypothetical protein